MNTLCFRRYAFSCVAVAMLAGCGGRAGNGVVPTSGAPDSLPNHKSFYYTGAAQDFTVPAGVRHVTVVARGAKGDGLGNRKANGGRVHATIPVTPGEKLVIYVGGDASETTGGFNGGAGTGKGYGVDNGYGGGGASDVRQGRDPVVPAMGERAAPRRLAGRAEPAGKGPAMDAPATVAHQGRLEPLGLGEQAAKRTAPAAVAAVVTVTTAEAVVLRTTQPIAATPAAQAGAVEATRHTPSAAPRTCASGKGGKTRNAAGSLSSVGNE